MAHEVHIEALENIHRERNKSKLLRSALGFLRGIHADKRINATELEAMHVYMLDCHASMHDPDLFDILDQTESLVAKAKVDAADEDDLLTLINDIIEYRSDEENLEHEKMEELLGICEGLVADNKVNLQEAKHLYIWLSNHSELIHEWPATDIFPKLKNYLEDGELDAEEANDLLVSMKALVGGSFVETGSTSFGLPTEVRNCIAPEVIFEGRTFCFTGEFFYGKRKHCEAATRLKGGIPVSGVSKKLDYLIVGSIASPFWITSSYGTKIKKVMSIRNGSAPYLVGEDVWRNAIA